MMTRRVWSCAAGGVILGCRGGQVAEAPAPAVAGADAAVIEAPVAGSEPVVAAAAGMLARAIPRTGERLPAIGMGTWETFDVGPEESAREPLRAVLRAFAAGGGAVIDSSPMYGAAEAVTGDLVAETGVPSPPFLATKVWTRGRAAGAKQMKESMRLLRAARIDLLQVHNLVDFAAHIETLRGWKEEGLVRYVGATHYVVSAFAELERVIREERLDFVQIPYSLAVRDAEARLLPAAADHGVAVLVNRPFDAGGLFNRVRGVAVPAWAADLECTSWAQLFLKFILSHPAVHCPLPATRRPEHMADNVKAGVGPLPGAEHRRRMIEILG
jgi:diketogulonate reductase-like aldo/keto reductase